MGVWGGSRWRQLPDQWKVAGIAAQGRHHVCTCAGVAVRLALFHSLYLPCSLVVLLCVIVCKNEGLQSKGPHLDTHRPLML